jgi:hypothetical protein
VSVTMFRGSQIEQYFLWAGASKSRTFGTNESSSNEIPANLVSLGTQLSLDPLMEHLVVDRRKHVLMLGNI